MENENTNYLDDKQLNEYTEKLSKLRCNGVTKISDMKQDIAATKRNKLLDASARNIQISKDKKQIEDAKIVASKNKVEAASLTKEAVAYSNALAKKNIAIINKAQAEKIAALKNDYAKKEASLKKESAEKLNAIIASYANKKSAADLTAKKEDLRMNKYELKSSLFDAKSKLSSSINKEKAVKNQAYIDLVQKNRTLRNGSTKFSENVTLNWQNYKYQFKPSKFLLDNGLYITIIIFFIVCFILAPISGNGNLLSLPNIFTILEQSSVRMFYALGVAGLILLAGTDLSIGRMVAMGAVVTGLILHPGKKYCNIL